MRELHVVALSEDGRHVVLATRPGTASGEFRVALDERLAAAVRGELPAPGRDAPPSISPRDIQARLRDGEAPEEIAASAGVPLSRVERYAGPVLAERERMITGARTAVVSRPRLGPSALPLGEAVETHLAEVANLAEGSVRWSARRTDLGRWIVGVSWTARGRRRTAGWHYDPATREVTAVDGPSAVLGHVEAEAAPTASSGRAPRPAAPAAAPRGAGRAGTAGGTAGSSTAEAAVTGRAVRAASPPTSPSRRTTAAVSPRPAATPPAAAGSASARTSGPRPASARPTTAAPTPPSAPRRRAATPTAAAPPPARGRPAPPPVEDVPAAAASAARSSARRAPARSASAGSVPTTGTSATGRAAPRRTAPRRSAVPPVDGLEPPGTASRTAAGAPQPPASTGKGKRVPATPVAQRPPAATPAPPPPSPPVLRVVPPAGPEPVADAGDARVPGEARPARRAAGQRSGGQDWADVLMGGAPAPEPGQE